MNSPFNEQHYNKLLEGLEISEVLLSDIKKDNEEFRIDDGYYKKEYLDIYKKINNYVQLKDIVSMSDVSSNGSFRFVQDTLNDNYPKVIPYIRSGNVGETFINSNDLIKISQEAHSVLKLSVTKLYDVMMARKGKIGGASIITERETNFNCNENVIKLSIEDKEKYNPFYFTAFFNSKYGLKQVERLSTGNVQPWLSIFQIRKLRLEVLSVDFQKKIEQIILCAHNKMEESESLLSCAERIMLEALSLKDWAPQSTLHTTKTFSEFIQSGRLDAEYYQRKYDELFEKLKDVKCKTIREIKDINYRGFQPEYVVNGTIDVINSKHILEDGLDYDNFEKTDENSYRKYDRSHVNYGDILTYTTGANIGRTQVYLSDKKAMASNHVNMLRVKNINPVYVALVLNSFIGRMQTEKYCSGSAQVELYPDDLEKFIIPILSPNLQKEIANLVLKSFDCKKQSKHLLQEAKQMVEAEIENDNH